MLVSMTIGRNNFKRLLLPKESIKHMLNGVTRRGIENEAAVSVRLSCLGDKEEG